MYPGQRSPSLRDVSISVVSGEAVALVGATGSGKSTLLQHLCALYLPQSGVIELFGKRIGPDDGELARLRRRAALLFQRPEEQLFERYVGDEVAYGPRLAGVGGKALTERVRVAMESAGLSFTDFKDRLTFALSGGEQRKVGIADVLALEPVALLLDEPTAGLDPESREQTMRLVERLKAQGTTIVVATHDMNEVARIADRTVALVEGSVVFDGPTREFFERGLRLREMGLDVPDFVLPLIELANRGAAIPRVALSLEETCELLGRLFVETGHDRGRYAAV